MMKYGLKGNLFAEAIRHYLFSQNKWTNLNNIITLVRRLVDLNYNNND